MRFLFNNKWNWMYYTHAKYNHSYYDCVALYSRQGNRIDYVYFIEMSKEYLSTGDLDFWETRILMRAIENSIKS